MHPPAMTVDRATRTAATHIASDPSPPAAVLVPVTTAARMLGIGRTKVYELIGAGELELVHIGRSALVPADSVRDFADRLRSRSTGFAPSSPSAGVLQLRASRSDDSQPPAA